MTLKSASTLGVVALAFAVSACSKDGSTENAFVSPLSPSVSTPTTITVNSLFGGPAAGVTVISEGKSAVTDANGVATFSESLRAGTPLRIEGSAFLNHGCTYGGASVHGHALLPVTDELNREFLRWMMFFGEYGENRMKRMTAPGSVILEASLRDNPKVVSVVEKAVELSTHLHPSIPFHLKDAAGNFLNEALPGTVPIGIVVDPTEPVTSACRTHYDRVVNSRIEKVTIRCRTEEKVAHGWEGTNVSGITHELGHAFGIGHIPNHEVGVMGFGSVLDFTPRERKVVEFMLARPPGTEWEDVVSGQ